MNNLFVVRKQTQQKNKTCGLQRTTVQGHTEDKLVRSVMVGWIFCSCVMMICQRFVFQAGLRKPKKGFSKAWNLILDQFKRKATRKRARTLLSERQKPLFGS